MILLALLCLTAAQASVFTGRENICNLAECSCSLHTVSCSCSDQSSFQVTTTTSSSSSPSSLASSSSSWLQSCAVLVSKCRV